MRHIAAGIRRARSALAARFYHHPGGQRVLRMTRGCRAPVEWLRRARAARACELLGELDVDARYGCRALSRSELPGIDAVLERCARRIDEVRPRLADWTAAHPARFRIAFDLLGDAHLARWPEFLDLALCAPVLGAATRYLGSLPILRRLGIGYSPPSPEPLCGSQLFHFDGEDSRQLKLFVALSDVELEDGPLTFHPADVCERIRRRLPRSRPDPPESRLHGPYSDELVERIVPERPRRLLGPPGTALFLDTSRCLHFGGRVCAGHERFLLVIAFRRFPAVHETPYNVFDDPRFAGDSLRRAVLHPPRSRPLGWFCPAPEDLAGPEGRGRPA